MGTRSEKSSAFVVALGLAMACSDALRPDNTDTGLPPTPFVVSNPVAPKVSAATRAPENGSASVVSVSSAIYVSLPPGAIPGGTLASIRDRTTTSNVTTPIVSGGFDPVAVQGTAGDTLDVAVQSATSRDTSYQILVFEKARPMVVRTSPPGNKRDVSLNTLIVVVFSEPMDSASVLGAVTLNDGGSPIGGHVVIPPNGGDILEVTFVPDAPLVEVVTYTLRVETGARDRDGESLPAPVVAEFTTSALPADVTAPLLTIVNSPGEVQDFEYPTFRAHIVEDRELRSVSWQLDALSGEPPLESGFNWGLGSAQDATFEIIQDLRPGPYSIRATATDAAGNTGRSESVRMNLTAPTAGQGIAVRSFTVVEYRYASAPGQWYYAPQLVVAAAPGQGQLEIVGLEMLTIPGLQSPFPRAWATGLQISPLEDTPFFREYYGDYDLAFLAQDGHRSTGGQTSVRITYRDGAGRYLAQTIQAPIVPGGLPTTYSGGCSHWSTWAVLPADLSYCGWQDQAVRLGSSHLRLAGRP